MNEEDKKEKRKAAQAAAHKKWRESEKGKAYYLRQKLKQAGVDVVEIQAEPGK
jgi:TRAP-type C4-dicarboxylate transport system substrate-binding protein